MSSMRHATAGLLVLAGAAFGHIPYLEQEDFSKAQPFSITRSIEDSLAGYAWLKFRSADSKQTSDVDVYTFRLDKSTRVAVQTLVPKCSQYASFLPWFAVIGPGLPPPAHAVPFKLPEGYGAIVVQNLKPGEPRSTFYEPFGGKSYYNGPKFDQVFEAEGTYYVVVWSPKEVGRLGGDYVIVFGYKETWRVADILRALIVTPKIRRGEELHIVCK
jgi:hypothetical protein